MTGHSCKDLCIGYKNCSGCINDGSVVSLCPHIFNPVMVNVIKVEWWMMIFIVDSSGCSEEVWWLNVSRSLRAWDSESLSEREEPESVTAWKGDVGQIFNKSYKSEHNLWYYTLLTNKASVNLLLITMNWPYVLRKDKPILPLGPSDPSNGWLIQHRYPRLPPSKHIHIPVLHKGRRCVLHNSSGCVRIFCSPNTSSNEMGYIVDACTFRKRAQGRDVIIKCALKPKAFLDCLVGIIRAWTSVWRWTTICQWWVPSPAISDPRNNTIHVVDYLTFNNLQIFAMEHMQIAKAFLKVLLLSQHNWHSNHLTPC